MTRRAGDGAGLLAAYRSAVENLAAHVDEINALNVFPVPDGDTGSNMLATVRAALAEAEAVHDPSADRIAQAISFGALMGARGNSGVIASQIFRGMAEGLGGKQHFNGPDLAQALTQGTATAYKAVVKPVEGTILTVIRESAAAAVIASEEGGDLEDVLTAAVEGARQAVARTPSMLPILRDAGVVDAGGEGLYRIMQGALQYLVARTSVAARTQEPASARLPTLVAHADEGFGYETMFLLQSRGAPLDVDCLREALGAMGESVLVAGDTWAVKVHVHNERPDEVIALGLSMGALTRITVENLDAQSSEVREKRAAEVVAAPVAARAKAAHREGRPHVDLGTYGAEEHAVAVAGGPIGSNGANGAGPAGAAALVPLAVVAVAAGDGLTRIFDSYGVAAVVHGGQSNNPSIGELLDAVEKIAAEEILLLPNNPNVILAARQASELSHRRVRIVPTRNAAEGFAALLAMDPRRDATINAELMTLAGRAIQTLQVTEAVRDATIGGRKVKSGQTIVLDPDDGLLAVNSDRMKAVLAALAALEPGFELITLYYGDSADLAEAESVGRRIVEWRPGLEVETIHGGQPHYRYLIAAE
ncbi:MAG TPA: DAK2 domain-containing protein [Candidatus Limnocylindrales bacterium]